MGGPVSRLPPPAALTSSRRTRRKPTASSRSDGHRSSTASPISTGVVSGRCQAWDGHRAPGNSMSGVGQGTGDGGVLPFGMRIPVAVTYVRRACAGCRVSSSSTAAGWTCPSGAPRSTSASAAGREHPQGASARVRSRLPAGRLPRRRRMGCAVQRPERAACPRLEVAPRHRTPVVWRPAGPGGRAAGCGVPPLADWGSVGGGSGVGQAHSGAGVAYGHLESRAQGQDVPVLGSGPVAGGVGVAAAVPDVGQDRSVVACVQVAHRGSGRAGSEHGRQLFVRQVAQVRVGRVVHGCCTPVGSDGPPPPGPPAGADLPGGMCGGRLPAEL